MKERLRLLARMFFPSVCPVCLSLAPVCGQDLCAPCGELLKELSNPRCPGCGGSLDTALAVCADCLRADTRPWQAAVSVFPFRGPARELIHRFKYSGHTYLAPVLASRMAGSWRAHGAGDPDVIVPVPLHWRKRLRRGYNQALLLALHLSDALGVPMRRLIRRKRWTTQQAMLDFSARQANMGGVFSLCRGTDPSGLHILLVDDVLTTGATLSSAAQNLMQSNASAVSVITAARG